jgi:hypothetical protein
MATATIDFQGVADAVGLGSGALTGWTLQRGTTTFYTINEQCRIGASVTTTVYSYDTITPTGDSFVEADILCPGSSADSVGLALSIQSGGDCLFTVQSGDDLVVRRQTGGSSAVLHTYTYAHTASRRLKFQRVGDLYTLLDGSDNTLGSFTYADLAVGKTGVAAFYATSHDDYGWDNIELGDAAAPSGLTLDSSPTDITRGSTGSFTISNPATAPTTGNTTLVSAGDSLTVDSVTGSDPYTINFTCPSNLSKQHDATGYAWTITVDAENVVSGNVPLLEPAGWDYVAVVDPVTTEGSFFYNYTGDAPVTGQQLVYETHANLESVGADGEWVWSSLPASDVTIDAYVINADGTIGTTGTATFEVAASVDVTPDAFTFTDATGVEPSTLTESNTITITGVDAGEDVAVTVVGGEYAVDAGAGFGGYTATGTNVQLNYDIKVRGTSNAAYEGTADVALTAGGVSDTFTMTTRAEVTDVTAPTLSSPTGIETGHLTASGTVTTNEGGGTLYYLISSNSSEVASTIKAGNNKAVVSAGVQNVYVASLTPETVYYLHYVHDDNSANESNVVSSGSFTTEPTPLTVATWTEWLSTLPAGSTTQKLQTFFLGAGMSGSLTNMMYEYLKTQSDKNSTSERYQDWKDGGFD